MIKLAKGQTADELGEALPEDHPDRLKAEAWAAFDQASYYRENGSPLIAAAFFEDACELLADARNA